MKDVTGVLPDVIRRHIDAHNIPDPEAFVATFAEHALLDDAHREFVGHADIAKCGNARTLFIFQGLEYECLKGSSKKIRDR